MVNKLIFIFSFTMIFLQGYASFKVLNDTCQKESKYQNYKILKVKHVKKKIYAIDISRVFNDSVEVATIISIKDKNEKHLKIKKNKKYKMKLLSYFRLDNTYVTYGNYNTQNTFNWYLIQGKKIRITSNYHIVFTPNLKGLYYINPAQEDSLENVQEKYKESAKRFMLKFVESIHTKDDSLCLSMVNINKLLNSIQTNLNLNRENKSYFKSNLDKLTQKIFNMFTPEQRSFLTPDNICITLLNSSNDIFTFRIDWNTISSNKVIKTTAHESMVIAVENSNLNFKIIGLDLPTPDVLRR